MGLGKHQIEALLIRRGFGVYDRVILTVSGTLRQNNMHFQKSPQDVQITKQLRPTGPSGVPFSGLGRRGSGFRV